MGAQINTVTPVITNILLPGCHLRAVHLELAPWDTVGCTLPRFPSQSQPSQDPSSLSSLSPRPWPCRGSSTILAPPCPHTGDTQAPCCS